MVLGVCRLQLILPEAHSLKEKRSVVQSLLGQVRRKFNVAISEVEEQDRWQVAGLGFCVVSSDGRHANRMMAEIMDFLEQRVNAEGGAQLGGYETELIHAF
ncbi:MAG: DUF503 domain-containing protein [Chloroflexota bacterium]